MIILMTRGKAVALLLYRGEELVHTTENSPSLLSHLCHHVFLYVRVCVDEWLDDLFRVVPCVVVNVDWTSPVGSSAVHIVHLRQAYIWPQHTHFCRVALIMLKLDYYLFQLFCSGTLSWRACLVGIALVHVPTWSPSISRLQTTTEATLSATLSFRTNYANDLLQFVELCKQRYITVQR